MFAPSYFGPRYFAPRYFAPNTDVLAAIVDRTDAPFGQTRAARRWIREHSNEVTYSSVDEAIKALEAAAKKPNKQQLRKATKAVRAAVGVHFDPYDLTTKVRASKAIAEVSTGHFEKAQRQLELLLLAMNAFKRKEQQEEDAIIAILLAI